MKAKLKAKRVRFLAPIFGVLYELGERAAEWYGAVDHYQHLHADDAD